jgi:hypothetical protein
VLTETVANPCSHVNHENLQQLVNKGRKDIPFKLFAVWLYLFKQRNRETGECEMPNRRMMRRFEKTVRTIQNYTNQLCETGWLEKVERRFPGRCRSEHNIYRFPHLRRCSGEKPGAKICGEKHSSLSTTTTTPAQPARGAVIEPDKSKEHLRWELRRIQDALDALRMRGAYAERGRLWLHKAKERCRRAMEPGIWKDPSPHGFSPHVEDVEFCGVCNMRQGHPSHEVMMEVR